MGVSNSVSSAVGMSAATAFVLTLASVASFVVNQWLLKPLGLEYLQIIALILVIAALVQLTELYVLHSAPLLHRALGVYLPLITSNCAVLGVALLNIRESHSLVESAYYAFGAALCIRKVMIIMAATREKIAMGDMPKSFRCATKGLITAGLMALPLMGFTGFAKL